MKANRQKVVGQHGAHAKPGRYVLQVKSDLLLDAFEETYVLWRRTGLSLGLTDKKESYVIRSLQEAGVLSFLDNEDAENFLSSLPDSSTEEFRNVEPR